MGIDTSMGFVAFPRGLTAWEWYDDPNTCRLFFHLLLTANWEPKNWHGIVVSPGSRVASVKKLAEETGLTIKNVRTSLEKLKTTNYLAIKATNKYSVISIENWGAITGSGKLTGNQPANNRQTNGNQLATTKPLKQINNITSSFPLPPSQQGEAPQAPAAPPQHVRFRWMEPANPYGHEREALANSAIKRHPSGVAFKYVKTHSSHKGVSLLKS